MTNSKTLQSLNDIVITETYKQGQGVRVNVTSGFAYAAQKKELVGLTVLVEAKLNDGSYIPKGSTVYVAEDEISTLPFGKNVRTSKSDQLQNTEFLSIPLKNIFMVEA
jgi:hypothetical protein